MAKAAGEGASSRAPIPSSSKSVEAETIASPKEPPFVKQVEEAPKLLKTNNSAERLDPVVNSESYERSDKVFKDEEKSSEQQQQLHDIEQSWKELEREEYGQEMAIKEELVRQEKLEQLACKFERKSVLCESYLNEMIQVLSNPRYSSNLNQVGASVKKHEAISANILGVQEGVQVKEEDNTEVKEQDEAEKMLCESEKVEKEGPVKEVGENLETTVHEDVIEEMPKEEEKAEEVIKSPTKEVKSPKSPIKEVESPESPMQEVDQKMAEDMDDIINMCKEIDAKKEAEKVLEKLEKVEIAKTEEEELDGGDLSQEEDEEDRSSQCKHCGVDMVIESELKKHVLLRFSNLANLS